MTNSVYDSGYAYDGRGYYDDYRAGDGFYSRENRGYVGNYNNFAYDGRIVDTDYADSTMSARPTSSAMPRITNMPRVTAAPQVTNVPRATNVPQARAYDRNTTSNDDIVIDDGVYRTNVR
jgi:hypothetical protein